MIQTKQELFDAIAYVLNHAGPMEHRANTQAQIEAHINDFLGDIVKDICDAVVQAAEEDILSRSGRK